MDWDASIHDHSQLELTFDYEVARPAEGPPGAAPTFEATVYLVAPPALDLSADNYPKQRFWSDVTRRMRLHTPDVPAFRAVRLGSLDRYLACGLDLGAKAALAPRVVQDVKLFGNHVTAALKRLFDRDGLRPGMKYKRDLQDTVEQVRTFRERYVARLRRGDPLLDEEVVQAVLAADEYLTERLEGALSQAALAGKGKAERVLRSEAVYSREAAHADLDASSADRVALERYYHRHGKLKKFLSEVLYLHPRDVSRDKMYRNLAAAGGAALAAAFAETARFYNTSVATGTSDFGFRVAFFLGLAVIAYVFKDRLKDASKEYFGSRVAKSLPDRATELVLHYVDQDAVARDVVVATHHENLRHGSESVLPDDARYVWERLAPEPTPSPPRDVLEYRNRVVIQPSAVRALEWDRLAVKDILRLDTSAFLSRFDDPLKELAFYDAEAGLKVLEAPKVYYLDVVLRLVTRRHTTEGVEEAVRLEALRVVLDKNGLVRLDRPVPRGRYHHEAAVG